MCDYSAKSAKQRAAAKNDRLVSHGISAHTNGFVDASDTSTAVCLLPGTELAFDRNVQVSNPGMFNRSRLKTLEHRTARFRQVEKDNERTHHDTLEFPDGSQFKLNDLPEGQYATVLQLPAAPKTDAEAEAQRRAEYV